MRSVELNASDFFSQSLVLDGYGKKMLPSWLENKTKTFYHSLIFKMLFLNNSYFMAKQLQDFLLRNFKKCLDYHNIHLSVFTGKVCLKCKNFFITTYIICTQNVNMLKWFDFMWSQIKKKIKFCLEIDCLKMYEVINVKWCELKRINQVLCWPALIPQKDPPAK